MYVCKYLAGGIFIFSYVYIHTYICPFITCIDGLGDCGTLTVTARIRLEEFASVTIPWQLWKQR